jgi:alpha-tubulin suppressor-like RCC1 family protein
MKRALATLMLLCLGACNALSGVGDFEVVPGATSTTSFGAGAGGATSSSGKGGGGATSSSGKGGGGAGGATSTTTASGGGMGGAGAGGDGGGGGAAGDGGGGAGGGPLGCKEHADCPSEACLAGKCATIVGVAAGNASGCAVLSDGTAHCWGANGSGQLGDGTTVPHHNPKPVPGLTGVVELALGRRPDEEGKLDHACARLVDGSVKCWGNNGSGQLGLGPNAAGQYPAPQAVPSLGNVTRIAAGGRHTCALDAGGTVHCWGADDSGQVGDGGGPSSKVALATSVLAGAKDIALGSDFSCALMSDTTVQCWGDNEQGQLGAGSPIEASALPVAVKDLTGAVAIAAGRDFACAKKAPNDVWCWGDNDDGQLATGSAGGTFATPVAATGLTQIDELRLGVQKGSLNEGGHGCAVLTTGVPVCWGKNDAGQVGDGTQGGSVLAPKGVAVIGAASKIAPSVSFTCALLASGPLRCWGRNNEGQLGIGMQTGNEPLAKAVLWP